MPWFKIDDKAHSHPKWLKAGNAAIGLFVRAGSYSAQHLTEGIVPGAVAQLYGTAPQAAKLVKVGLWHGSPHECPRCPQPAAGDYVIHDFFEGGRNSTRAQVEDGRKRATDRKAKQRDRENADRIEDENDSNRLRFEDEKSANRDRNEARFPAPPQVREGRHSVTPQGVSQPPSSSTSSNTSTSYGSTSPLPPEPGQLPVLFGAEEGEGHPSELRQLVRAMGSQGMDVSWPLNAAEWHQLREQISRVGLHPLVEHAARAWQAAKNQPYSARYFLAGWLSLQPAPTDQPTGLRALGGPSKTTDYLASMAAIAEEYRQKGTGS